MIESKVNYVVQEAVVVIKDIFRKYPNRYESIIATLCENLEELDEPEAKASMIWIIGEYAERIDNADELLDSFLESFADETATVHLHPQTLIDMASMTGRFYLDSETADMIVTQPSEYFPSQLEYALPHNDQVASQLRLIETEIENNIRDHDTGEREHGPGLIN